MSKKEAYLAEIKSLRERYEAGERELEGSGLCETLSHAVFLLIGSHYPTGYSVGEKVLGDYAYLYGLGPNYKFNEARYKALDLFEAHIKENWND